MLEAPADLTGLPGVATLEKPFTVQGLSTGTVCFYYDSGGVLDASGLNTEGEEYGNCEIRVYLGDGTGAFRPCVFKPRRQRSSIHRARGRHRWAGRLVGHGIRR